MNKQKIIKAVICPIVIAAILFNAVLFFTITGFTSYISFFDVSKEENLLSASQSSVKILQLTDVQTANIIECAHAYPMIKSLVDKTKPDLIVLTGDTLTNGSSKTVLRAFVSLMDSFELPWGLVFGNHDRNSDVPIEEISAVLEESEYSIFKTGEIEDSFGNYYYNIKLGEDTVRTLFFLDSGEDGFTKEQVDWYENTVLQIAKKEEKIIPSFVFFHIPIAETEEAHEQYESGSAKGSGEQADPVRTQTAEHDFFETLELLNSTDGLFYGHDHRNNTFIEYNGVMFCYGRKTGINAYYEENTLGGNIITVTKDGFSVERVN